MQVLVAVSGVGFFSLIEFYSIDNEMYCMRKLKHLIKIRQSVEDRDWTGNDRERSRVRVSLGGIRYIPEKEIL